jgi:hypothetical protein
MSGPRAVTHKKFQDLHRSVRFADVSRLSVILSLFAALVLSLGGLYFKSQIIGLHQQIVQSVLVRSGVPGAASTTFTKPWNFEVSYPALRFPGDLANPVLPITTGVIAAVLLLAAFFSVRISRTLVMLLLALLGISMLNLLHGGTFGADAGSFTAIWLRFEFVTWLAVPWLMAVFAGIVMPAGPAPLFWTIMPPFYAILWSAFRLAFCLGILSFTGPLLAPVLWFAVGALADMLYVSVFYSFIAAHASSLRRNERDK